MNSLKIRRILASTFDFCFCFFIFYVPLKFLVNMVQLKIEVLIFLSVLTPCLIFTLYSLKDTLYLNQSLGKKIFKLKIYEYDANIVPKKSVLISRGIISLFTGGLNVLAILISGRSISDIICNTKVIEKNENKG